MEVLSSECNQEIFRHSMKDRLSVSEEEIGINEDPTVASMKHDASEHGMAFLRRSLEDLLSPAYEDDLTEDQTPEELGSKITGLVDQKGTDTEEDDPISIDENLKSLAPPLYI